MDLEDKDLLKFVDDFCSGVFPLQHYGDLYGRGRVAAWLKSPEVNDLIRRKSAERNQKIIDDDENMVKSLLALRPQIMSEIAKIATDKDHKYFLGVAKMILTGELGLLDAKFRAIGDRLGSQTNPRAAPIIRLFTDDSDKVTETSG